MTGIFERIAGLAGTELSKAVDLAHTTFQGRMSVHKHTGRALVETAAEVCRNHPNLVGIGAGLLVERLLVEEKHRHDAHVKATNEADAPETALTFAGSRRGGKGATQRAKKASKPKVKLHKIRPMRIAFEVLGGLMLLKLGAFGARLFRRRQEPEIWFAPAARIHMISAAIATYNLAAAIRSPRISALRNGAVAFFGTEALKPLLKTRPGAKRPPPLAPAASAEPAPVVDPDPAGDHGTLSLTTPWTPEPAVGAAPIVAATVAGAVPDAPAPEALAKAEPAPPELAQAEPAVLEPAPTEEIIHSEPAHPEPVHPEAAQPEAAPEGSTPEPAAAESVGAEPVHAEAAPDAPARIEPAPAAAEPPWASFSKVSEAIHEIADGVAPETPAAH